MPTVWIFEYLGKLLLLTIVLIPVTVMALSHRRRWNKSSVIQLVLLSGATGLAAAIILLWLESDVRRHTEMQAIAADLGVDLRTFSLANSFPLAYILRQIERGRTTRDEVHSLTQGARALSLHARVGR